MLLIDCLKCTNFTRVTGFRNDEVTGNLGNPEPTGFRYAARPYLRVAHTSRFAHTEGGGGGRAGTTRVEMHA